MKTAKEHKVSLRGKNYKNKTKTKSRKKQENKKTTESLTEMQQLLSLRQATYIGSWNIVTLRLSQASDSITTFEFS